MGCTPQEISEEDQNLQRGINSKTTDGMIQEIIDKAVSQAMRDIQKKFSKLSQEQIETAEQTAREIANPVAQTTAQQIANRKTQQAINDIEQKFSNLSQENLQNTKETAKQVAEDTAEKSTKSAIESMQTQFSDLSQKQIETTRETAKEIATQTAREIAPQVAQTTAEQIANEKTQKAIDEMQKEFSNLSELQIQIIKSATLEIASQISKETAKKTSETIAKEAIETMEEEFSKLSERELEIAKKTAQEVAEKAVGKVAQDLIDNIQKQFSDLTQDQLENIEKLSLELSHQVAQSAAESIAQQATEQAIDDMKERLSDLSELQIQTIKSATLEIANQISKETATQIAETATRQAIENMKEEFANLSQEQILVIKELAVEVAKEIALETAQLQARNTAQKLATEITDQAISNMEDQFSQLSETEIQAIKTATLETAEATSREVIDTILEDIVKQRVFSIADRAIKDMESKHSALLKAGLQTIISAAISAVTASVESMDDSSQQEAIDSAINSTIEAAKDIAFGDEEQSQSDLIGRSFNLSFEQCSWKNRNYTSQLVKNHTFFSFYEDPLKKLLDSWQEFKEKREEENYSSCSNTPELHPVESDKDFNCFQPISDEEFAYLSPLYDDFILSFFQESIEDTYLSEDDVPLECFFAGAVKGANLYGSDDNFYYCSEDSDQPGNMTVIDDNEKTRTIPPQRACLNRDYMFLTAKAFNKTANCFGFDKAEKEILFKLFNHESSFLHNIKSPTSARCYGQLTKIAITEINKQIYFSNSDKPLAYSFIFDEVLEDCSGLQNAVLHSEIYQAQTESKNMSSFNSIHSKLPISCKITQNPYSCLFYAFYNFKINSVKIEQELQSPTTEFGDNNSIPQEFKDSFLLPIFLSEMRGVTGSSGRDMIFWDDSEIWSTLKNQSPETLQNIRSLPLFQNEKEVKDLFKLWAYNGGISISDYMQKFIKQLKQSIASPCSPEDQSKVCQYRFAVQQGQGIATKDIKKDFQAYIIRNYELQESTRNRRIEVKTFAENVENSLNYLYNKNGLFRVHLKNLVPELENQDIENFQDYLEEICPKVDPSLLN